MIDVGIKLSEPALINSVLPMDFQACSNVRETVGGY